MKMPANGGTLRAGNAVEESLCDTFSSTGATCAFVLDPIRYRQPRFGGDTSRAIPSNMLRAQVDVSRVFVLAYSSNSARSDSVRTIRNTLLRLSAFSLAGRPRFFMAYL
jgi:hypothetical protein